MPDVKNCHCINSAFAVYDDMLQAVERIEMTIMDQKIRDYFQGYRDAINGCRKRFELTQSDCCCFRKDKT